MIFNGHQNPETLLWGYIADKLGEPTSWRRSGGTAPKTPGVDEWVAVLGDEPVLILLDELPSYLQMAQGEPVGATTLGDLTIGALERLFNALPRCPRACVVVTNLKDDVYLDGSGQLRTLIENLTKHYDRNAQAITPVQQNTGEVFAIVRKRLFDGLPSADRIDEVAQAYVAALQKAKRVDTIPTTPETFIERIRETYPFHPSIRDIVARFAENRGYQKTRALIRLLRLAVRGALAREDNAFLIGLQHLDFNDQATLEEIRKINPAYAQRDLARRRRPGQRARREDRRSRRQFDRVGRGQGAADVVAVRRRNAAARAHGWRTDRDAGRSLARSLGDQGGARPPARPGVVSVPGRRPARLLRSDRQRHGRDHRDRRRTSPRSRSTRRCATSCRRSSSPRLGQLYSDRMAILPALDEIQLDDDRPTLIILERPADKLPQDFVDWWNKQDLQNRVLVLTADPNAVDDAAHERAANARDRQGRGADQGAARLRDRRRWRNSRACKDREAAGFTSALRETFKTIVFPMTQGAAHGRRFPHGVRPQRLFRRAADHRHADQARKVHPDRTSSTRSSTTIRLDAEEILFDADAVQQSSLRRNAAVRLGLVLAAAGRTRPACQDIAC